jgi:RimJ/RimL family protein N-acetyltransferase
LGDTVFETERLLVRRWRESELPNLMAVYGDDGAMKWVGDGQPITEVECERWILVTNRNYEKHGYGLFAVELKYDPGVIGFCGIVHAGGQEEAEVKYADLRRMWGLGIATEAMTGLMRYAARVHGIRRIVATTAPEDAASHRVLVKAGMNRGELRSNGDGSLTLVVEYREPSRAA